MAPDLSIFEEIKDNPAEVLVSASRIFGNKLAFATSLGAEDQVLTDMISRFAPSLAIFTLDTGRLPQETYDLIEATRQKYRLKIEIISPDEAALDAMVTEHGPDLFYQTVELRQLCCGVRKVQPLQRKLKNLDAWICGLRQEQSVTRAELKIADWDEANGLVKICPLANWSTEQVWDYLRQNQAPYNRLHGQGYPSIGCAPCTRAIKAGEDIRAGRWWWESPEHKECGLHAHRSKGK